MTFEGFDAAPLIEQSGFTPAIAAGLPVPEGASDGTLEAALHQLGGARAAIDSHDLWVGHGAPLNGRTGLAALLATSAQGLAAHLDVLLQSEPDHTPHGKPSVLRAAFDDVDGDGQDDGDIVVKGSRPKPAYMFELGGIGGVSPGPTGLGGSGVGAGVNPGLPATPNCGNSNQVEGKTAPDGAKYLAPESVTDQYLQAAVDYVTHLGQEQSKSTVLTAIYNMYENRSDPHFVDFKDWGTSSGPLGSVDGGRVTYFSTSLQHQVTADAFEAFGNFFFGVICTMGGLSLEETRAIAALAQSGRLDRIAHGDLTALVDAMVLGDDPQDRPFVNDGVASAQAYQSDQFHNGGQFGIKEWSCPNG